MKRAILVLLAIGWMSAQADSMWALVPLDDLVQDSDLIVVGTLSDVFEYSNEDTDHGEGAINIEEVIWGQATPGEPVILKWQNESKVVCPRIDHKGSQNQSGIWLLTTGEAGTVRANYPGRFVELSQRAKVERSLQKKKVSLRANKYLANTFEPINVSIVFRNPTQSQIQFPGLEYNDGYLYIDPDIEVSISSGWGDGVERVSFSAGRVFVSESLPPIIVEPGQEHRTVVNLGQLFDVVPEETYSVMVRVKGYGCSNQFDFYANTADQQENLDIPKQQPTATIRPAGSRRVLSMLAMIGVIGLTLSLFVYRQRTLRND